MMQIHGIQFEVLWDEFKLYSSFFIPCLDVKLARKIIRENCRRKKFKVRIKTVTENKLRGVRVWRLEDD